MDIDHRCCGTGTCIINQDGECWCGQKWDGQKMCFPPLHSNDLTAGTQGATLQDGSESEPKPR